MKLPKPYKIADETIAKLNKKTVRLVSETKRKLTIAKFDELNVLNEIDSLFSRLDADNRKRYKELFVLRYLEMMLFLRNGQPYGDEDSVYEMAEMYVMQLLEEPDAVTHYSYDMEVYRKRDRAKEAITSVPTHVRKQIELDKAIRFWNQMSQQYADVVSDVASIIAMQEDGIEYAKWHTQEDDKVCVECNRLDGKKFRLSDIPPKPHWRCRCWLEPLNELGEPI